MTSPLSIDKVLRDYFLDENLTKPIYGSLHGRKVEDITFKHKTWHRIVHLVKYALHWPGYRDRFNKAANEYICSLRAADAPASSYEDQPEFPQVHHSSHVSDSESETSESVLESFPIPDLEQPEEVSEGCVELTSSEIQEPLQEEKPDQKEQEPSSLPTVEIAPISQEMTSKTSFDSSSSTSDEPQALSEVVVQVPLVPQSILNEYTTEFLLIIKNELGEQAALLWDTLFTTFANHHGIDFCSGIEKNEKGEVTLQFDNYPLKLHTISTDEKGVEDPFGGVVLTFASEGLLRVRFVNKQMHFLAGYDTCSGVPESVRGNKVFFLVKNKLIKARVALFEEAQTKDRFISKAVYLSFPFRREKSFAEIMTGWSTNASVLDKDQDAEQFIKSKRAS